MTATTEKGNIMRQSYLLKASLIGAIFLTACAEAPQNSSEGLSVADASTASSNTAPQDKGAFNTKNKLLCK